MTTGKTRGLLGAALLLTALASWFAPPAKDDGVTLSERAKNAATGTGDATPSATHQTVHDAARANSPVEVLRIRPRESAHDEQGIRLFASTQWTQNANRASASNATPPQITPAAPQAPPLPFRFLGRYEDAGQTVIFLQHNDQNLVVRVGDKLAEQYQVESLHGTSLNLRYLPLNQPQSMEVGGTPLTKE